MKSTNLLVKVKGRMIQLCLMWKANLPFTSCRTNWTCHRCTELCAAAKQHPSLQAEPRPEDHDDPGWAVGGARSIPHHQELPGTLCGSISSVKARSGAHPCWMQSVWTSAVRDKCNIDSSPLQKHRVLRSSVWGGKLRGNPAEFGGVRFGGKSRHDLGGGRVCRGEGCHSQPQEPPSAAAASVRTTAGRSSKGFQADPTARRGEVLPLFTAHVRTELL